MKKVIIVSKTHLDLGFTGLAADVLDQYIQEFIPKAVTIAQQVNADKRKFVWTISSWMMKEALLRGTPEQQEKLYLAVKRGDIVAHAFPFTTHTELLDRDTVEYGLSIIQELDKKFGKKTIAAKMTDVPGHTISLVPILAKAGIKLLHIGVNGASALPDVPPCFLWKNGDHEMIVIYDGSYGGSYKSDLIDDILYLDHSLDNHGPRSTGDVLAHYKKVQDKYPGYDVTAGSLDDYAALIWKVKDKLPVVTSEIGDTWIHGACSDPYKVAAMRTLLHLKNKWLQEASITKGTAEYKTLADNLMCVAEHTWGMDSKCHFGDYQNYLRKDFDQARKEDRLIKRGCALSPIFFRNRNGKHGIYSAIEQSWAEQRAYLDAAKAELSTAHREEANKLLHALRPSKAWAPFANPVEAGTAYQFGRYEITLNPFGGIQSLSESGTALIHSNKSPLLEYRSYGAKDYAFWLKNYTRDFQRTRFWAVGDFARPRLKKVDKKYPQGIFNYQMQSASYQQDDKQLTILAELTIGSFAYLELGAPKTAQIKYVLGAEKVDIFFQWLGKPANRLPESLCLRLYPNMDAGSLRYVKIGAQVDPFDVVKNGGKKISAVQSCVFSTDGKPYTIENFHAPIIGLGQIDVLHFDNQCRGEGLSYLLHNNIWGTNFPLWYDENALFQFQIRRL